MSAKDEVTLSSKLEIAEKALERGDYKQCLTYLEELSKSCDTFGEEGAKIQLLMITALMGEGEIKKAILLCKKLAKHQNYSYRQQAKDLISILDAPVLSKPENWSVTIPALNLPSSKTTHQKPGKSLPKNAQPSPPTGPTQPFQKGFTILVTTILFVLTILLSGCVQFTTNIELIGPDRLKVTSEIQSNSNQLLPWQEQFNESLKGITPKINIQNTNEGKQVITSSQINSKEANLLLQKIVASASKAAALNLPSPKITLKERNLFIGVEQHLSVYVDLNELPELPGLKLAMDVNPSPSRGLPKGEPLPATINGSTVNWELAQGRINKLELQGWKWNNLGIGVIFVFAITILTILTQNLKIRLGFGFPELPP